MVVGKFLFAMFRLYPDNFLQATERMAHIISYTVIVIEYNQNVANKNFANYHEVSQI